MKKQIVKREIEKAETRNYTVFGALPAYSRSNGPYTLPVIPGCERTSYWYLQQAFSWRRMIRMVWTFEMRKTCVDLALYYFKIYRQRKAVAA